MLPSDRFGEQVGRILLAFCVGDRDLSGLRHFLAGGGGSYRGIQGQRLC